MHKNNKSEVGLNVSTALLKAIRPVTKKNHNVRVGYRLRTHHQRNMSEFAS